MIERDRDMTAKDKWKLDGAIAERVYDALPFGGFAVGDEIEVDIRFGDEDPDENSWTRCEGTVQQHHIDLAKSWLKG